MSTTTTHLHGLHEVKADNSNNVTWCHFKDISGNTITVFVPLGLAQAFEQTFKDWLDDVPAEAAE